MIKISELSVFFPAYNEEENIKKTILSAVKILKKVCKKWEVLVIDDGSKDKTAEIVKQLSKKQKRIKLIRHKENKGYGAALKTGFYSCKYKYICYTDSDGQFDFKEIKKFISAIRNYDLVIGYRKKRTDRLYRRFLAKILRFVNLILFNLNVKDVDCGFKLFKREILYKIGKLITASAITETEFVVRAQRLGFKIKEIGVLHHSRREGEQTGGKIKVILKASWEGLKLWWLLKREKICFS